MSAPAWLTLFAPLPPAAKIERVLIATPELIESGQAEAIAGWHSIRVFLSEPEFGLRHVQITTDGEDRLIAGGDYVMYVLETTPDGMDATLTEHVSLGGRFEADGSFLGTHWKTVQENSPGEDEGVTRSAERRAPSDEEIAALRHLIADILRRVS